MTTLTIDHTAAGGTVLRDTARGDGAAEALRAAGGYWRWSRNIAITRTEATEYLIKELLAT